MVSLFPSSTILPFEPPIIKPTDLVTETFNVNWTGTAAGGTSITSFAISYKLDGGTAWMLWKTFPGTVFSAVFPWKDMGLSDGAYGFRSVATNNLGQSQPPSSAAQAVVYVDMADEIDPVGYLPFVPTED